MRDASIVQVRESVGASSGGMGIGKDPLSEQRNVHTRVPNANQHGRQLVYCAERDVSGFPDIRLNHIVSGDILAEDFNT